MAKSSSQTELSRRIARLEDIESVRRLVADYGIAADRGNDPVLFAELLAADAVWEAEGFGRHEGAATITAALAAIGRDAIKWSLHYMVSPRIDIDEDGLRGKCHWYLWELARISDEKGERRAHWIGGWYDTELLREDGRWKFLHIKLSIKLLSEHKDGWNELP
ncbi:MAG: nuclear transport factor 2 family protein [Rhodocyclaceae bacterium]|nr:MAG: nuclear transport factor 2 family protein [Rhodocyclaceae bacterium]